MRSTPIINLEVGGVYLVKSQKACLKANKPQHRKIVRQLPPGSLYEFEDDQGEFYTKEGRFLKRMPSNYDLIKRIS
ncbi:hypothetical protein LZD49_07170 [Dyadobacter sp. CY261]|uniref:hypothetical protein n=1 Tax=Dyadobacter sp. CY261 TaxID=2907203 RepID=UPI001F197C01|nr:hypothetical protein [Dyadobacter sp. CY261]MCF0070246.1 hypothetical protein [Dyadobacter sp. CY261]